LAARLLQQFAPSGGFVLDIGCGVGFLANDAANSGYNVTAIDPSPECIKYASRTFHGVTFYCDTIEHFSKSHASQFDVCTAHLVLHNIHDLNPFLQAARLVLKPSGVLLGIMLNPDVWFLRRRQVARPVVKIDQNCYHVPFQVKGNQPHPSCITYFHRTLPDYFAAFDRAGFDLATTVAFTTPVNFPEDLALFILRPSAS
jgi:SAM-dependent methyltransferase